MGKNYTMVAGCYVILITFLGISNAWGLGLRRVLRRHRVTASRTTSRSAWDKVGRVTHRREQGRGEYNERASALFRAMRGATTSLFPNRRRFFIEEERGVSQAAAFSGAPIQITA